MSGCDDLQDLVSVAIANAEPFDGSDNVGVKPRLLVEHSAPDRTVAALRDLLSGAGGLYDRGVPVRLAFDQTQKGTVAQIMTPDILVLTAHTICRPYAIKEKKGALIEVDVRFPRPFATMYLDWRGEWRLPALNGIASAPLLGDNGDILSTDGFDPVTGMWCERVPDLARAVPDRPSRGDAEEALNLIRRTFRTFCFADAPMVDGGGVLVVDIDEPPGKDESAFIAALLTAVCRPSLPHAPGVLIKAASMSGAGAGKGLLARCIAIVAFGREPHAVTGGATAEELEKRIAAELIEGSPVLFLDNLNNTALRSNLLASAITERPAKVRILGRSQMVPLNASAFTVLTGNGLTVSEDLARRFITVELDPRTEDPEARRFANDMRADITRDRAGLLAAALTVWRWGRLEHDLPNGRPLGSFEVWCRWVRDPLVALGCLDPAERVGEAKQRDGRRQSTAELFAAWWDHHGDMPIPARNLADGVRVIIDPQGRGRQFVSAHLEKLAGTRLAGFLLTRQPGAGEWGVSTYALQRVDGADLHRGHRGHGSPANAMKPGGKDEGHRDHRGHRVPATAQQPPPESDAPYAPDGYGAGVANDEKPETVGRLPPHADAAVGVDYIQIDDDLARWEERAAIVEYEGGLPRQEAESRAAEELAEGLGDPQDAGDGPRSAAKIPSEA